MRSLLPQPRRAAWPQPHDSIGRAFGPYKDSKMLYWEAKGPALDAYKQLLPKMLEILKEKQGALPNSDIIWFGLYMVGPDMDNAMPHVMFTGENKAARKKALKIVKESGLLAGHPGMHVGHWAEPRHIGSQAPCAGSDSGYHPNNADNEADFDADDVDELMFDSYQNSYWMSKGEDVARRPEDQRDMVSVPSGIEFEHFLTGSRKSTILNIRFGLETVRATSGLVYESGGAEYCLTAAHVFFRPSSQFSPESPQLDRDSSEYEFDGFRDSDNQENSPTGTSEGSLTAPPSEGSDERNSTSSTSPLFQERDNLLVRLEGEATESQSMHHITQISESVPPQVLFSAGISGGIDHHYTTSARLDYTLHKLPRKDGSDSAHGMQILTSSVVIEPTEQGSKAQVHTSHGILSGLIKKAGTHVLLPGSTGYQEVFVAYLNSPVEAGDSGAVVSNETDQVYGHIVSGSSTGAAFVMPLRHVYDDITRISQELLRSRPRSHELSHAEPFSEMFNPRPFNAFSSYRGLSYAEPLYHDWILSDEYPEPPSRSNLWNEETTRFNANMRKLEGHTGLVCSTVISASANFMASSSEDTTIRAWDINSGTMKQRFTGYTSGFLLLSISANGKFLATAKDTGSVQILSLETGSVQREIAVDGRAGPVDYLAISSNGRFLAMRQRVKSETTTGERHRTTVSIWNVSEGIKEKDLLLEDTNAHTPMAITPNGKCVAALAPGSNREIWKWDVTEGEPKSLQGHNDRINSLVISHDGIFIITASDDKTVRVWDVKTGTEQRVLEGHTFPVKLAAISKSSEFVISASEYEAVRIWDWGTGVVQRTVARYESRIEALAVSNQGRFVMSASEGSIVRLWDEEVVGLRRTRSWGSMSSSRSIEPNQGSVIADDEDDRREARQRDTSEQRDAYDRHDRHRAPPLGSPLAFLAREIEAGGDVESSRKGQRKRKGKGKAKAGVPTRDLASSVSPSRRSL